MSKILIVDDDHDLVDAAKIILEAEEYEVVSAFSKAAGMDAVENEKPDLLILDVMMEEPDDGFVMAQEVRKKGLGIPILMLTSVGKVTGMQFDRDSEMVPVDSFEEKPISPDRLVGKVRELLA